MTQFPATEQAGEPRARAGYGSTSGATLGQIDPELMGLLRRLAYTAPHDVVSAPTTGGGLGHIGSISSHGGLAAQNLIVAHREELRQAATGSLDHMVIDVVGGLFDQILSDPKVPPQMARQIGRLQLPVLRAALGDPTFFSSRRHPVRRFVNRIASLAIAFDTLDSDDGKAFLKLVKDLVQEIVEGDFDQIELYEQKLDALEVFVVDQNRRDVQRQGNADEVLARKENQLRLQQRYAAQLRHGLQGIPAPDFLRDFVSSVWSQAVMQAALSDGHDSPNVARLRLAGRDLLMSVQPKGSPAQRKAFLIALPTLMKTLNAGMDMIKWPDVARKDFFGKLLPAHSESLKGESMRTLDFNLLLKEVDGVLGQAIPKANELPPMPPSELPVLLDAVHATTFTEAEAKAIGLLDERSIDWSGKVDVEIEAEPEVTQVDIQIDGLPEPEPVEPSRGSSLADHVQIGFAYQMHIDGDWHKVRSVARERGPHVLRVHARDQAPAHDLDDLSHAQQDVRERPPARVRKRLPARARHGACACAARTAGCWRQIVGAVSGRRQGRRAPTRAPLTTPPAGSPGRQCRDRRCRTPCHGRDWCARSAGPVSH